MVALIPYVRETFRRHLSPNQAVMLVEFDKLKRVRPGAYQLKGYRTDCTAKGLPRTPERDPFEIGCYHG
jgi:hypothetical protein